MPEDVSKTDDTIHEFFGLEGKEAKTLRRYCEHFGHPSSWLWPENLPKHHARSETPWFARSRMSSGDALISRNLWLYDENDNMFCMITIQKTFDGFTAIINAMPTAENEKSAKIVVTEPRKQWKSDAEKSPTLFKIDFFKADEPSIDLDWDKGALDFRFDVSDVIKIAQPYNKKRFTVSDDNSDAFITSVASDIVEKIRDRFKYRVGEVLHDLVFLEVAEHKDKEERERKEKELEELEEKEKDIRRELRG